MTDRTKQLLAAGIIATARRQIGAEISMDTALQLASDGSIRSVLERLNQRRMTKLSGYGVGPNDEDAQWNLALADVVGDVNGFDREQRRKLREELLRREGDRIEAGRDSHERDQRLEALLEQAKHATIEYKRFARAARRLYQEQQARLTVRVPDDEVRINAQARLVEVYCKFLSSALTTESPEGT